MTTPTRAKKERNKKVRNADELVCADYTDFVLAGVHAIRVIRFFNLTINPNTHAEVVVI